MGRRQAAPRLGRQAPPCRAGPIDLPHPTALLDPCDRHRYFFKLFVVDRTLGDLGTPTKAQLEKAMKGHVLAQAEIMGTYQKRR